MPYLVVKHTLPHMLWPVEPLIKQIYKLLSLSNIKGSKPTSDALSSSQGSDRLSCSIKTLTINLKPPHIANWQYEWQKGHVSYYTSIYCVLFSVFYLYPPLLIPLFNCIKCTLSTIIKNYYFVFFIFFHLSPFIFCSTVWA